MNIPDSYANLMGFVPEKARPMVEASMKLQAERQGALQQEVASRQAALEQQRAMRQGQLQKSFDELDPETKQFPAVQHDLKRQRILNDMRFEKEATMLSGYGEDPRVVENRMKMVDDKYKQYEEDLKPVEKTEQYGVIKQNWQKIAESNKRVNTLISTIAKTKELLDSGNKQAAMENIRTNVLKPLNSIDSDDALQIGEVLLKFNKVMSAPETAEFAGKKITNPTVWFNKYLQAKTKQEKEGIQKGFFETIETLFDSDPEGFLETAIDGANSHVDSYNKRLKEQVINTTSPGVARRMGAVPLEYVSQTRKPQQQQTNPLATENPFGQSVSGGAGAAVPVVGQSQQANPLSAPIKGSTIFRIK
jgi:hypothetical protein